MWIRANLVLGASGQTTFHGTSKGLSSRFDRARFHEIRAQSQAIVIGGETARREPYAKTPVRLIILSNSGDIPEAVRTNPLAEVWELSPVLAIAQLRNQGVERILVEAGKSMLFEMSKAGLLDGIYLTQTTSEIGENPLDIEWLTRDMEMVSAEDSDGESFIFYSK